MRLAIYAGDVKSVKRSLGSINPELDRCRWKDDGIKETLDFNLLSKPEIEAIEKVVREKAEGDDKRAKHYQTVGRKLDEWHALFSDEAVGKPIKKLDLIPAALIAYFKDKPHKWVFRQAGDGSLNPYFITGCKYKAAYMSDGDYYPATVTMKAQAYRRDGVQSISVVWYARHLDRPMREILTGSGLMPETPEAMEQYRGQLDRYMKLRTSLGLQMSAIGEAQSTGSSSWYRSSTVQMVREGVETKVVLDDEDESSSRSAEVFVRDSFWGEIPNRNGMAAMDEHERAEALEASDLEPNRVELPVHTYLRVFDLDKHQWLTIHAQNLKDFEWDKTLIDKLVIRGQDKDLISLLVSDAGSHVEDIVKGKMRGVIVLATGVPGIGKTLTAEVFSEMIEKPLYTVQCSQLGLNVDQIEKNLGAILARAARWGAILLIDEADVYIRQRGDDITQNAIVGVFLRLIEYYNGVLFMTSNRADVIDDAIISRATAHIQYRLPDNEMLARIWQVLGRQYDQAFTDKEAKALVEAVPEISGRTVRNLLKLGRKMAGDGKPITEELIKAAAEYQPLR